MSTRTDVLFEVEGSGYKAIGLTDNGKRFIRFPSQRKNEAWYRDNGIYDSIFVMSDSLDVMTSLADSWGVSWEVGI